MAPKPNSSKVSSPKKPTGANTPKVKDAAKSAKDTSADVDSSDGAEVMHAAPTNKEEALGQISFDGLPSCPSEDISTLVGKKYEELVKIFAHYCKASECKTVEMATRMRLVGFKKLIKDSGLELKVYDIGQMSRLFNLKGGAKVCTRAALEHTCSSSTAGISIGTAAAARTVLLGLGSAALRAPSARAVTVDFIRCRWRRAAAFMTVMQRP